MSKNHGRRLIIDGKEARELTRSELYDVIWRVCDEYLALQADRSVRWLPKGVERRTKAEAERLGTIHRVTEARQ